LIAAFNPLIAAVVLPPCQPGLGGSAVHATERSNSLPTFTAFHVSKPNWNPTQVGKGPS